MDHKYKIIRDLDLLTDKKILSHPLLQTRREKLSWGAKPRIELGPALQQADPLPTELRRTQK
jgi:hypothetical protein